jgi:WD40 repeat protein
MKKFVYVLICLTVLLSGCGTLEDPSQATPASSAGSAATPEPASVSLSMDSTSAEIQAVMLESATKWGTIWMEGTVTWYDPTSSGQPPQVYHEQDWIDQSVNRFRILLGPGGAAADTFKVCDGATILELDLKSGQSQTHPLPEFAKASQYVPTVEPGVAYPNPLWGQIDTPLSELIFSADRAQNQGTFKPVAVENVAGRQTLAVEWTYVDNQQPSFRAWLDVETAVILKLQEFGKSGGSEVQSERVVDQVAYDAPMSDDLFNLQFSQMPTFSDISGNPLTTAEPAPTFSSESGPLGQVYFFITDHEYGNETTKLVRLPGSCVTGQTACPEPETISPPFGLNFSLTPLVWSPDGKYAALAYPVSQDGNTANLFLFDPEKRSWQPLAKFNFIDPPVWSPDGGWLAFRTQDGEGGEDVHAVRRDGSDLRNMTASDKLPPEDRPYILNGWIEDNLVLRSGYPGGSGLVYLVRMSDSFTRPLFDVPWNKSDMVPSPDGSFIAYTEVTGQKNALKILTLENNNVLDLATFHSGSIYPILWSPDSTQVAFSEMASEPTDGQDVFVIGRDGRHLQQVYRSTTGSITTIAFSPDGLHLLVQDDDATGRHIYVVDLSTLEIHLLQAPGLPLDWWWLAPSWRPKTVSIEALR